MAKKKPAKVEPIGPSAYEEFVSQKLTRVPPVGFDVGDREWAHLFDFQRALVRWALARGRCAIFASTGLGKTRSQLTWADEVRAYTSKPVLVVTPLAVARQTIAEGETIGIPVNRIIEADDVRDGINVINYDRIEKLDPSIFGGVVWDESSCAKHVASKTAATLIRMFGDTPFRLACTATPSPNDHMELGQHAELLGICSRAELLAEFFTHDGGETQKWVLRGHARQHFWKFVASWGALIRSPEDLGFDGSAYVLPPLTVTHHTIEASQESIRGTGLLFAKHASSLMERRQARRGSVSDRVAMCADLVNASEGPFIVWCDLNDESKALTKAIPGAVEVTGSMSSEEKEAALDAFSSGKARVVVSKPSICGWGLHWVHCNQMAFVGVTDSWEAYHQATKRIHRFGQKRECFVHVFASELEGAVIANLARKERDAELMSEELSREAGESVREAVLGSRRITNGYEATKQMTVPEWLREEGACGTRADTGRVSRARNIFA